MSMMMDMSDKKVRLQVMVDQEIADKIKKLAALLNGSESGVAAKLLEEAIKDNEWVIRRIAAPIRKSLDQMFGPAGGGAKQRS